MNADPNEGDGRIKFTSKQRPTNSLLSGILQSNQPAPAPVPQEPTPTPAPVQAQPQTYAPLPTLLRGQTKAMPITSGGMQEDDGSQAIKFKGKLKVDYKETSADKKRRDAEEESRKEQQAIIAMHSKKAASNADGHAKTTDGHAKSDGHDKAPEEKQGRGAFDSTVFGRKKKDSPSKVN